MRRGLYSVKLGPSSRSGLRCAAAMGQQLHTLLDLTIHYPTPNTGFWALLSGRIPRVVVRARAVPIPPELRNRNYQDDDAYRLEIQQWVTNLWEEKDAQLDRLRRDYPA